MTEWSKKKFSAAPSKVVTFPDPLTRRSVVFKRITEAFFTLNDVNKASEDIRDKNKELL